MPTLEVIQEKMKKLQAQADMLIAKKAQSAVDQIRKLMLEYGLTTQHIEEKAKARRETKAASSAVASTKLKASTSLGSKVAPKYQDPKSGVTWTGRGSAPVWISKAKDRTKFLIKDGVAATTNPISQIETAVKATSADTHRGQRTGPQPAKYRHPKSGASWSGRGPAPAWLANVKDRTKFLVDAQTAAPENAAVAKASGKTGATKKATASKKVAKKATAKKAAAKKATAAKKAPTKTAVAPESAVAGKKVVAKETALVAKKVAAKKVVGRKGAPKKAVPAPDVAAASQSAAVEATA
ncbi:H-NS family nucleoid-associated regulatory protein [Caballeronia sordidicola]|uniref:Histone protein n=1 Tax=Caballeronia sordidicola TaxID=196367 RepID=A0A226X1W9_CABSO|nr:H-NS family nucleoid-associated regulatory protein [Caballeronia sordidicola]OXC77462.1 histone protein [Caballeronia sordidicola]